MTGSMTQEIKYSEYYEQLEQNAKERYAVKLNIDLHIDDPYMLNMRPGIDACTVMPDIQYPDIYNYLINTSSPYTKEEFKAYKSLEGYKYLLAGWVGEISVHAVGDQRDKFILIAKVRHSQSVTAPHLHTWVAATKF